MSSKQRILNQVSTYELAFENSKDAIVIADAFGTIIHTNSTHHKCFGIPNDQDLSPEQWSSYFDIYYDDSIKPIPLEETPLFRIINGDRVNDLEITVKTKNDEKRNYIMNGNQILSEDNAVIGAVLIAYDITERKRSELKLKESESNYQDIVKMSSEAIVIHRNNEILFVNDAAIKIIGANNQKDLLGKSIFDYLIPHHHETALKRTNILLDGKTEKATQYKVTTLKGNTVDLEVTLKEIQFRGQSALLSMGKDITQEKLITENLEESEERYRSLFMNHSEAIITLDLDGNFYNVNPASEKLSGYKYEELIQQSFIPLLKKAHIEKVLYHFNKTLQGAPQTYECSIVKKQGEQVNLVVTNIPIIVKGVIQGIYGICKDITVQKSMQEKIEHMAFHDDLTGLPNRNFLNEKLKNTVINPESEQNLAVIFLDLDRFKFINDTLGHGIGDQLLIQVAKRIKAIVRGKDIVARLSGDEYVILLDNPDEDDANQTAESLLQSFNEPFMIDQQEVYSTCSIGISSSIGEEDVKSLLENADLAMYAAKQRGRNNYQVFTQDMNKLVERKLKIETSLRSGLVNNEFELYFQPQNDLNTSEIIGAEVLLRWEHPKLGFIPPDEFIPIAEETGLIVPLGDWVLQESCSQLRKWLDVGLPPIRIAVNISSVQLVGSKLPEKIQQVLQANNIDPKLLCVEMTESVMQNKSETLPILKQIKELGVFISIDDFGTGFSSLNYLKDLPIDELKIDKSFLQDILKDPKEKAIVKSIIDLGNNLALHVIVEGIENEDQVKLLKELNCVIGQGYYFNKPLPKEEFEAAVLISNVCKFTSK
ncbi:GGDEF domain-containing protein [Salipaludibacillus neizhouensis]|uniref:GGDEF domain-containing protein n=1 Tax=Salipaludibacillus neizhouensis TaxID=885475 RepID=A0A3A9KJH9_9BACI|nr:bifunctional diguanylate cyclase/phosphodiesterase [Salipaludibacillus neizhouensis]RKL67905.1 GGDEF domain-containing protein [Salipaludibacillus neizhouensis]